MQRRAAPTTHDRQNTMNQPSVAQIRDELKLLSSTYSISPRVVAHAVDDKLCYRWVHRFLTAQTPKCDPLRLVVVEDILKGLRVLDVQRTVNAHTSYQDKVAALRQGILDAISN